jgi:hypothetical protein
VGGHGQVAGAPLRVADHAGVAPGSPLIENFLRQRQQLQAGGRQPPTGGGPGERQLGRMTTSMDGAQPRAGGWRPRRRADGSLDGRRWVGSCTFLRSMRDGGIFAKKASRISTKKVDVTSDDMTCLHERNHH